MKAFTFRLLTVLEDRRRREETRALALARAQRAATDARAEREALQERLREGQHLLVAEHGSGSAGFLRNYLVVLEQLRQRLVDAVSREDAASREVTEHALAFQEASRDREVIARLMERRREEWDVERRRREQLETDETALSRHLRFREGGAEQ